MVGHGEVQELGLGEVEGQSWAQGISYLSNKISILFDIFNLSTTTTNVLVQNS